MEIEYTALSLNKIDNDTVKTGSIYVINNIDPIGKILFTCETTGKPVTVVVESTWVPQDLSTQTKKSDIVGSADFRRLVSTGRIHILEEKEALSILATPDAIAESKRVFKTEEAGAKIKLRTDKKFEVRDTVKVNPRVMQIVAKSNTDPGTVPDMSAADAVAALKATKDLTAADYDYVLKNSNVTIVKNHAAQWLGTHKA